MRRATSRDEYEYYAKVLHEEEYGRGFFGDSFSMPVAVKKQEPCSDPETPLSFLKNADKKLLLIGEIA